MGGWGGGGGLGGAGIKFQLNFVDPFQNGYLTLSVSNFGRHLSSAFFYFNKLSFGKTFICKVERMNVKQHRSR